MKNSTKNKEFWYRGHKGYWLQTEEGVQFISDTYVGLPELFKYVTYFGVSTSLPVSSMFNNVIALIVESPLESRKLLINISEHLPREEINTFFESGLRYYFDLLDEDLDALLKSPIAYDCIDAFDVFKVLTGTIYEEQDMIEKEWLCRCPDNKLSICHSPPFEVIQSSKKLYKSLEDLINPAYELVNKTVYSYNYYVAKDNDFLIAWRASKIKKEADSSRVVRGGEWSIEPYKSSWKAPEKEFLPLFTYDLGWIGTGVFVFVRPEFKLITR